jgi:hypothetical protein
VIRRLLRSGFGSKSQPDVLVALLAVDVVWNKVVPKDRLAAHDDRIGIQPALTTARLDGTRGLIRRRRGARNDDLRPAVTRPLSVETTRNLAVARGGDEMDAVERA